jgi:hypothetical protein
MSEGLWLGLGALDTTFWLGIGAVVAALVVFPGSIWLVLSMTVGRRLAYFIVVSIMLGALLILAVVWSFTPLGPVGELPTWEAVGAAQKPAQIDFGPAAQYPRGSWFEPSKTDPAQQAQAAELQTAAQDLLTQAIGSGKITTFASASDAVPDVTSIRFLDQNGTTYGAIRFTPVKGQGGSAVAVLRYDPGNPLRPGRLIAAGVFLLFVLHIAGLSFTERRAARAAGRTTTQG